MYLSLINLDTKTYAKHVDNGSIQKLGSPHPASGFKVELFGRKDRIDTPRRSEIEERMISVEIVVKREVRGGLRRWTITGEEPK
jgi:hypothetical protein